MNYETSQPSGGAGQANDGTGPANAAAGHPTVGAGRLIDTHAHLEELDPLELDQAIGRARQAGVVAIVAVGSEYESNNRVLEIAARYQGLVYPALGLHPGVLDRAGQRLERELQFIDSHLDQAVAVGEVGLDYHKRALAGAGKEQQQRVFRALLALGRRHGRPVIIHSRYAWKDSLSLAAESGVEAAVFHWFTGPEGVLQAIIDAGHYVSATIAAEYHAEHRRAVKEVPLDRLLLETDCPVIYRGHRSEPADVRRSLLAAAGIRGVSPEEVARRTTENAARLFRIV